jgi:hypothetical protein
VEASRPGGTGAWRFADPDYRDRSKLKTYELEVHLQLGAQNERAVSITESCAQTARIKSFVDAVDANAHEALLHRNTFGDHDHSIRSQTVIEHEVTTVVINSRHPLFLKRGGDIWYQLETAAREVFKSLEGASVGDYERRVNEVVMLAFQLRARRREPRSRNATTQSPLIPDAI